MNHGIIECHASRGRFCQNLLLERIIFGECVDGERLRPRVYELNAVLNVCQLHKDNKHGLKEKWF